MAPEQIISFLASQLKDRLEKLWRVFSWCSSILLSITGGMIVAARVKKDSFELHMQDRLIVSGVITLVAVYAFLWIDENLKLERKIRDQMDKIFEASLNYPQIKGIRPDKAKFGYKTVILLLGIIALAATWLGSAGS